MRFMSFITSAHRGPPTPELIEAMHKLADREIKAGRMLDSGGLMPIETGARISIRNGQLSVVDGPLVEAKEVIGGYAIFEFQSKEEAVASALEFMQLHKDLMPGWEGTCEVRAFFSRTYAGPSRRETATPAVGGHDGRRHPSRDPGRLADRAAPADHQPGEDAARRAAGRGPDAGGAAGRAGALAGDRRSGEARRLADGDRQAPGRWIICAAAGCSSASTPWSPGTWRPSSRPCPIWTPPWTTTSATSCCGWSSPPVTRGCRARRARRWRSG